MPATSGLLVTPFGARLQEAFEDVVTLMPVGSQDGAAFVTPAGFYTRIRSIQFDLVTSALVANRNVFLNLVYGKDRPFMGVFSLASQPASSSMDYFFTSDLSAEYISPIAQTIPLPDVLLPPQSSVVLRINGQQAGDATSSAPTGLVSFVPWTSETLYEPPLAQTPRLA